MDLFLKATVTGKRQITIPKEVCEHLNIETGNQVIFKTEGSKVTFEVEKEYETCFACNGTTKITEKECFVCRGTGKLEKDIVNDIYKLIGKLTVCPIRYGINIKFMQTELSKDNSFKYLDFPIIKLSSKDYSITELNRIKDEIQKLIIKQFSPRSVEDNKLFCIPNDAMLDLILNTLSTEKAKEEVTKWFRYEKVNYKKNCEN